MTVIEAPASFPRLVTPCLGEGEYNVVIRTRPTPKFPKAVTIGELEPRSLNWGRTLNGTSSADLTIGVTGTDEWSACCDVVNQIQPCRTNIEYYRDGEMVWLGVIVTKRYGGDTNEVTISSNDLSVWLQWRLMCHTMTPRQLDLADIFVGYLDYAFKGELPSWGKVQADDPPLYADPVGLTYEVIKTGILGDRSVDHHDLSQVSVQIDDLANTGVDWTVTNTKMWIGGSEIAQAHAPAIPLRLPTRLTDDFFTGAPNNRQTGEGMVTQAFIRGNGVRGMVGGPDDDGLLIQRVLDTYSVEDIGSAIAAAQSYHDLSNAPLTFVEGDNDLASSAPVDVQTLIPGTRVKCDLSGGGCVPYDGTLRLHGVNCNLSADDGEQIQVTLEPLGTSFDARGTG